MRPIELFLDRLLLRSVLGDEDRETIRSLPCHLKEVKANREFVRLGEITREVCWSIGFQRASAGPPRANARLFNDRPAATAWKLRSYG